MGEFDKQAGDDGDKRTEEEIIQEKLRNAGMEQEGGKDAQYGGKEDYSGKEDFGGEKPE